MKADHCSLWFEGVWSHCCAIHDASALDVAAAVDLGRCVAATGHGVIGLLMTGAVIVFGPLYLAIKRRRSSARPDTKTGADHGR